MAAEAQRVPMVRGQSNFANCQPRGIGAVNVEDEAADSRAHIALHDEPIPAPRSSHFTGPDMRNVAPIGQMFEWLDAVAEDEALYIKLWLNLVASVGCTIAAHYQRDGDASLNLGGPVDVQTRHRSLWVNALVEHLDDIDGRRDALMRTLCFSRRVIDERPIRRNETTTAVRGFLRAGGRIMIRPDGGIEEGGASGALSLDDPEASEIAEAASRYFSARRRLQTDNHLRRIVRMFGTPVNGWIVLAERPSEPPAKGSIILDPSI